MPRRVGVAGRFKRAPHDQDSEGKSKAKARKSKNGEEGVSEEDDDGTSWSFFGSKHMKSRRLGDDGRLEYLDLLPPKSFREEEHEISALMVHSR